MDKTFPYPTARQFIGQKFQVSAGHFLKISSTSAPYVKSRTTHATLDSQTTSCQNAYMNDEAADDDLYARLEALSKLLEGSGRIDERDRPDAYATILAAMAFVRKRIDG